MFRPVTLVYFGIGFLFGILSVIYLKSNSIKPAEFCMKSAKLENPSYDKWFEKSGYTKKAISIDELRYSNKSFNLESNFLSEQVKVLCVVLIKNEEYAKAASETWMKQCNDVLRVKMFAENKKMPTRKTKETSSWALLCKAILTTNSKDFDWLVVVNDNTFVILENLRLLVASLDPNKGHYLGHAVTFWSVTYNAGQAGYVLSKKSVDVLKQKFNTTNSCIIGTTYLNKEDFYLGKSLAEFNIHPIDTRDSLGLSIFHSFNFQTEFFPIANYYKTSVYPKLCCSSQTVTFQASASDAMYIYYYMVYTLNIFQSGQLGNRKYIDNIPDDEVWKSFVKERGYLSDNISAQDYYKLWEEVVHDPTMFAKEVAEHKYELFDN